MKRASIIAAKAARSARASEEASVPQITEGWKMVNDFRQLLETHIPASALRDTWSDPRRTFSAHDYLSLILIGLFNPAVKSLRGLCAASRIDKIQQSWGCGPMSLGSVSEAQRLIDPELLRPVIAELAERVHANHQSERVPNPSPAQRDARLAAFQLRAIDSTVMAALPRMAWAVYGGGRGSGTKNAVRLHLSFNVNDLCPAEFQVTTGKGCERAAWEEHQKAEKGAIHIGDRYFGMSFSLLDETIRKGDQFTIRMKADVTFTVEKELELTAADQAEGIIRQALVKLGKASGNRKKPARQPEVVRLIWIKRETQIILLATSLDQEEAPGELVALMYRHRWQVEFFFRWIKCLLGCGHWLAESKNGVTLQLYLVIICALLMQSWCGRRPSKRTLEMLQFYFLGLATVDDLSLHLENEAAREAKKRLAKKS